MTYEHVPVTERKKKGPKKKEREGLWKMTALRKSTKDVDSLRALEKPRKRRDRLFHISAQGPAVMNLTQQSI